MTAFMTDDFLLHNDVSRSLYHDYAKDMPIFDYHNHLPPDQMAENRRFDNLAQAWLLEDHYKWRAMRANGVNEKYITGDASDWEKFHAWASTVPKCLRNPLYHWTHLELKNPFGITELLNEESARRIYDQASEMLQDDRFTANGLLEQMNVKLVCTTDDPLDDLRYHKAIAENNGFTKCYPAWRPDTAMAVDKPEIFSGYVDKLTELTGNNCDDLDSYMTALAERHQFFHDNGCRLSDHGLAQPYAEDYSAAEVDAAYKKVRAGNTLDKEECEKLFSYFLYEFAIMDHAKGWVQQHHLGPLRNNSSRLKKIVGADAGTDSMGDRLMAESMSRFFDRLDSTDQLTKTIVYNLNPRDNALFATMVGNFQDGSVPGKMQFGSGWWFLDQKHGMIDQMNILSNMGLLSRFVGMLTDSRSFLSFPRHEYFRRILCQLIGEDVVNGELPHDMELLGSLVQDVCWNNAKNYFDMEV